MLKRFCDRCGKELDSKNSKYVGYLIEDHEDDYWECWDFCHECASNIKFSMLEDIAEYKKHKES